jgi:hypothetical protein
MNIINRYTILFALLATIAPAYAETPAAVKEIFGNIVDGHLAIMAKDQREINYWQNELHDATKQLKSDAKTKMYIDVTEQIKELEKAHKEYVKVHKPRKPWLNATHNIIRDPEIRMLKTLKTLLKNDAKNAPNEQFLIRNLHLPNAQLRHGEHVDALQQFDIHWLKRQKRIQKDIATPELHIDGFEKFYTLRKADIKALKQGYVLNTRTLGKQKNLFEMNRGIDAQSQIAIGHREKTRNISVARYEQMLTGNPNLHVDIA